MKKLCATLVPTNMSGNPLDFSWKTTNQCWTHLPHVTFSFEQNCKACFKGAHFQAIKDVHKKNCRVTKGKHFEGDNMYIQ
jgi:hypothetical protein